VVAALELGERVGVLMGRAESLGRRPELREQYDLVTARALGAAAVALEWTLPFARVGGAVALIKGGDVAQEVAAAERAAEELGGDPLRLSTYDRSDGKRSHLCVYDKRRQTPEGFPRRDGVPARRPL
jgi:16S rRNA (guanine527-N7)-methyltransferase